MRENYVFHILTEHLDRLLTGSHSIRPGYIATKVKTTADDPLFTQIAELNNRVRSEGNYLFFAWDVLRRYSKQELESARLFQLIPTACFAPEGERCGTIYDESEACPQCGAGGRIAGGLFVSQTRLPRTSDIAISIAKEIIVSQRLVDIFDRENVIGVTFKPLHKKRRKEDRFCDWYEWSVNSAEIEIDSSTRIGNGPFDPDPEKVYLCPHGDTLGLNLLSELAVRSESVGSADVMLSKQYIGSRGGVVRQRRQVLVSPKVRKLFERYDLKGAKFEIAHQI